MAVLALSGIPAASTCPLGKAVTGCNALPVMIDGGGWELTFQAFLANLAVQSAISYRHEQVNGMGQGATVVVASLVIPV